MQTIQLDISQIPAEQPVLRAKQADAGRKFMARITDNGADWPIPEDAVVSVWYAGTAGEGNYTHIGQRAAAQISGNTITVELIHQMLTTPGGGMLSLALNRADGSQLGLWSIHYWVEPVPGVDSQEATAYYNAFAQSVAEVMAAAEKLTFPVSVAHGGTGAADAAAARANLGTLSSAEINTLVSNGKTKVTLLWQNANSSATFEGEQYIDLGENNTSSVYDCVIVLCRYSTGLGHYAQSDLLKQNLGASVYYPKGYVSAQATRWFRRDSGANGRYLYVSSGYLDGAKSDSYCIPHQVYGIKW